MSHIKNPYDRNGGEGGASAGFIAIVASVVLHAGALVAFIVLGSLHNSRNPEDNTIRVQLIGPDAPQAPAAPKDLPVDPDQKGPDVREAPPSTPAPPIQTPPESPKPVVTPPSDVIPLGPKAPEKPPEIKKTPTPPPKPTPPKVEPPKPKPQPKPKPNLDDEIKKKMEELKRKKEADEAAADDPDSRLWNINRASGQGEGSSSESGGATRGERIDPEQERYFRHIRDIISHNWLTPSDVSSIDIVAAHTVVIQPDGQVSSSLLVRSSGNESFDLSVERAIQKSAPLPPLPAAFGGKATSVRLNFSLDELQRGR